MCVGGMRSSHVVAIDSVLVSILFVLRREQIGSYLMKHRPVDIDMIPLGIAKIVARSDV